MERVGEGCGKLEVRDQERGRDGRCLAFVSDFLRARGDYAVYSLCPSLVVESKQSLRRGGRESVGIQRGAACLHRHDSKNPIREALLLTLSRSELAGTDRTAIVVHGRDRSTQQTEFPFHFPLAFLCPPQPLFELLQLPLLFTH